MVRFEFLLKNIKYVHSAKLIVKNTQLPNFSKTEEWASASVKKHISLISTINLEIFRNL